MQAMPADDSGTVTLGRNPTVSARSGDRGGPHAPNSAPERPPARPHRAAAPRQPAAPTAPRASQHPPPTHRAPPGSTTHYHRSSLAHQRSRLAAAADIAGRARRARVRSVGQLSLCCLLSVCVCVHLLSSAVCFAHSLVFDCLLFACRLIVMIRFDCYACKVV